MSNYGNSAPPPAGGSYGASGSYGGGGTPPNNQLVPAILATIFCCLPLGVVAIVKASSVNGKWASGDHAGAYADAEEAKKWVKWSVIAGIIYVVLVLIWAFLMGGLAAMSGSSSSSM